MKVYTTIDAWNKMSYWAKLGGKRSREFTCFGRAVLEDGDFRVTDVYLVKQEGTSGGVDGDNEDINRLMIELYNQGIEPDEAFRCWIHSHPGTGHGATYLSGTDESNIERYLTGDFLISIVLDSDGKSPYCRIDLKNPRLSIEADVEIELPELSAEEKEAAEDEFKEKSSSRAYTIGKGRSSWIGGPGGSYQGPRGYVTPYDSDFYSGGNSGGKVNGAAGSVTSRNGGAVGDSDIVGRPDYDSLDGMALSGVDVDEWEEWARLQAEGDGEARYAPKAVEEDNTGQIELNIEPIDEASVPEWLVSMADEMACTVEDLESAINVKEYDEWIDDIVFKVQCGYGTIDDAVEELCAMGIAKAIAETEIDLRVNS